MIRQAPIRVERDGLLKQFYRGLIFGLAPAALLTISCKSHPVAPPVQHPPSAAKSSPPSSPSLPRPAETNVPRPTPNEVGPGVSSAQAPEKTPSLTGISRWIRIGLATDLRTVRVTSKGPILIENLLEATSPPNVAEGAVTLALQSPSGEAELSGNAVPLNMGRNGPLYRIQIAAFRESSRADSLKHEIESRLEVPVAITFNEASATYRVRAGECHTRVEAEELGERLQEAGYAEGWIVSEEVPQVPAAVGPSRIRPAVRPPGSLTLEVQNDNGSRLAAVPLPNPRLAPVRMVKMSAQDAGDLLTFDKLTYRGTLEIVENARGKLNVVNILDLDDYLKGVVPNEMPPSKFDAIEALKAQAVAARTYALKNEGRFKREGYQLCATIACQVYRGADSERPLSTEAVEATRGIVIKYQGELIDSLYTSTCGGHTEDAKNVFRTIDAPYLRGTSCPPENTAEVDARLVEVSGYHLKWTVHVTRTELERTLRKTLPLDELVDLEPVEYGISNRVIELKVKGRKQDFTLKGLEVKSALGLKDSLFILDRVRDRRGRIEAFDFIGHGWGHGVGLCQTGAYGLARKGQDFESILKTYYYNVDVVQEDIREN